MTNHDKTAKERILETAISLFAQRGYAAVGVREIAKNSNVNVSMISYYYQGKIGILKSIFNAFHDEYLESIQSAIDDNKPPEACVRAIIHNMVDFVHEHVDLTMVVFNTLPLDIPEITELKAERIHRLIDAVGGLFGRLGLDPNDKELFSIIGPSLLSIVLAHFRVKPVQRKALGIKFDDMFYDRYKEIISTILLRGVKGLSEQYKRKNGVIDEHTRR